MCVRVERERCISLVLRPGAFHAPATRFRGADRRGASALSSISAYTKVCPASSAAPSSWKNRGGDADGDAGVGNGRGGTSGKSADRCHGNGGGSVVISFSGRRLDQGPPGRKASRRRGRRSLRAPSTASLSAPGRRTSDLPVAIRTSPAPDKAHSVCFPQAAVSSRSTRGRTPCRRRTTCTTSRRSPA